METSTMDRCEKEHGHRNLHENLSVQANVFRCRDETLGPLGILGIEFTSTGRTLRQTSK